LKSLTRIGWINHWLLQGPKVVLGVMLLVNHHGRLLHHLVTPRVLGLEWLVLMSWLVVIVVVNSSCDILDLHSLFLLVLWVLNEIIVASSSTAAAEDHEDNGHDEA